LLFGRPALAHHNPGHAQSESVRTLTSAGKDPSPRQRVALLFGAARGSAQPTLNTATSYSASLLANVQVLPRIYLGVELPFVLINEDASDELLYGYGDTRAGIQFVVGDVEEKTAPRFTVGAVASFPTRTYRFIADPGNQWVVSPGVRYAQAYKKWFWFALLQAPIESRPAGSAVEVTPSLGVGYQFHRAFAANVGASADVRVLSYCERLDGSEYCSEGRVTEVDRAVGTVRGAAYVATTLGLADNWSLLSSFLLPVTRRRDVEWLASLGIEARF